MLFSTNPASCVCLLNICLLAGSPFSSLTEAAWMSREFRRASQMSGEWVYPNQALIWALWVLAAATEGEIPSGRGGLSEGRVRGFPYLGGLTLMKMQLLLSVLWGPMEGCAVTSGHLINVLRCRRPKHQSLLEHVGRAQKTLVLPLGCSQPAWAWGALRPGRWEGA